jgi:hypothetical protein
MEKLPIKIAIAVLVVGCLYWVGSATLQGVTNDQGDSQNLSRESARSEQMISSIQAISDADAVEAGAIEGNLKSLREYPSAVNEKILIDRFSAVNQLISQGKSEIAISELEKLTREYPRVIEPYINLAALYASSNQLDLASTILDKAMRANPNTAVLFKSVQAVYGAKAAMAYQLALGDDIDSAQNTMAQKLDLPIIASLDTRQAQQSIIDDLQAQLAEAHTNNASDEGFEIAMQEQQSSVIELQSKLEKAEQDLLSLQATHASELSSMREQLAEQNTLVSAAQSNQSGSPSNSQQQAADQALALQAERAALEAEQERERAALLALKQREADGKAQLRRAATELVKSWAASWAAQDVTAYINHYEENYTPAGSSINHMQWREQRRVRLTNKRFIQVDVSNISVIDEGDRFTVNFTQHYRSNTVDDRIRKRLVYAKKSGDLSDSKIVAEAVI